MKNKKEKFLVSLLGIFSLIAAISFLIIGLWQASKLEAINAFVAFGAMGLMIFINKLTRKKTRELIKEGGIK